MRKLTALAFLIILLTSAAIFGQEADQSETDAAAQTAKPIEEISVIGQRSLSRLRLLIYEKEDEIYEFFNANNSSDRMDIICTRRRPTGTYIMKRECEPKFIKDLRVEKTRDARMGIGVGFTQRDLVGLSAQDYENLQNEMLSLMSTNDEFSDALADLADLSEDYEAQRQVVLDDD